MIVLAVTQVGDIDLDMHVFATEALAVKSCNDAFDTDCKSLQEIKEYWIGSDLIINWVEIKGCKCD